VRQANGTQGKYQVTSTLKQLLPMSMARIATGVSCSMSVVARSQCCTFSQQKRKEKFTLFSDHNRSLLKRQPGAVSASILNVAEITLSMGVSGRADVSSSGTAGQG